MQALNPRKEKVMYPEKTLLGSSLTPCDVRGKEGKMQSDLYTFFEYSLSQESIIPILL